MRHRRSILLTGFVLVLVVATMVRGLTIPVTFPTKATKVKLQAIVDEAGNVLFGTSTPGKVEVTNLPPTAVSLSPSKASDLVDLVSVPGGINPCLGSGVVAANYPGGASTPFTIPDGQVLVLTTAEVSGKTSGPGHGLSVYLIQGSPSGNKIITNGSFGTTDSSGFFSKSFVFPTGVRVTSGMTVCAGSYDYTASDIPLFMYASVTGYLAPDM